MKWYDSPLMQAYLATSDMVEESPGLWRGRHRTMQLLDGGLMITTITLPENPKYDIETVHAVLPDEESGAFFKRALQAHIEEIKRRTVTLRDHGLEAVENKPRPSN